MAENTKMEENEDKTFEHEEGSEDSDESSEEEMEQEEQSDEDADREPVHDPEIHKLELQIEANPFNYQSHIQLIDLLQQCGDLDRLRKARQNMTTYFPLTEELWLAWVKDELPLACLPEHRKTIRGLFEKGVQDYQSVKLWIEYCQFVMDTMEGNDSLDDVRATFEKAITAAGLHVTEGSSIWDGYREFEMTILDSLEQMLTEENKETMNDKIATQKERVHSIYRRQLAIPLLGMQGTMRDFEDWLEDDVDIPEAVVHAYEKAEAKLEEILPFEDTLSTAGSSTLEAYKSYLQHELQKDEPVRIQCLYERALKANCLVGDLWMEYTSYLDSKLKTASVVLPAHERALRNCPWVSLLWQNYLRALERTKQPASKIKESLDKALTCGFTGPSDYLQLWRCYCNYMRRNVQEWKEENQQVKDLRDSLKSGVEYLQHYFGNDGDGTNLMDRYWARIEAYKLSNMSESQRLWDGVMSRHGRELEYWLEYANVARSCGDLKLCRKILQRAVQSASDNPEGATQALLSFEEEEGTLEDWDSSFTRCQTRIKIVNDRRAKAAEKESTHAKAEEETTEKRNAAKAEKKAAKKVEKKAKVQQVKQLKRKAKSEPIKTGPDTTTKDEGSEPVPKKPCVEKTTQDEKHEPVSPDKPTAEEVPKYLDRSTDPRKVFISNLLFGITEDQIKEKFSTVGEVVEVRLVRNMAGRSKGYAYVEFKDESPVPAALALDREKMEGRPMFISPCVDKTKNPTTFKFPTSLDKNTLFVSNLAFDIKESELEELFSKHGAVKQVRLVTNRAGKPKGYGYVEYEQEHSAQTAVMAMDMTVVKERTISVALSNPPARKTATRQDYFPPIPPGSRGRAKTQLQLIPRSLQKPAAHPTSSITSSTTSSTTSQNSSNTDKAKDGGSSSGGKKGFSNDYFRNLLQKK